jgi:hypothetical protein
VPHGRLVEQPLLLAELGHPQLGHDGADLVLDRLQSDHGVQFGQRLLDAGRLAEAGQA